MKAAGAGVFGSALGVKTSLLVVAIAAGATATGGFAADHERRTHVPAQAAPDCCRPVHRRAPVAAAPKPRRSRRRRRRFQGHATPIEAQAVADRGAGAADRGSAGRAPGASVCRRPSWQPPANDGPPPMAGLTEENVPIASALAALANGAPD